jgi:hypothetical protein
MNTNAHEEEQVLADNQVEHDTEQETETVEPQDDTEETTEDDSISVNRADYEKLQREAAAAKRLREKASKQSEKSGQEGNQSEEKYDQELIERTFLAAQLGIQDADVQDEAIRLARKFDMSISSAVKDDDIKTRLESLQKQKQAKQAMAKNSNGTATQNKGVDYWVARYKKDGSLPDDSKMIAQVMDKL